MSARNFRFKSPGVRFEEIDQSAVDAPTLNEIGPVIIGRSPLGPSLKPVKVNSVEEFVGVFGNPSPGGVADSDLWRNENNTSPHYGAYAALAYLRNSAPVTFIRLGGLEHPAADTSGQAGWITTLASPHLSTLGSNGGAYGLWLIPSASSGVHTASTAGDASTGGGMLGAIFYMDSGSGITLTSSNGFENSAGLHSYSGAPTAANIKLHLEHSIASGKNDLTTRTVEVSFNPSNSNFIRKAFNTSPILTNASLIDKEERYWLGETFENNIKQLSDATNTYAFITPLGNPSETTNTTKADYRYGFQNPKTGWIFSQDMGAASAYDPIASPPQELFRLVGLSEGQWASRNLKVSISNISYTPIDDDAGPYGSFNIYVRLVSDSDSDPAALERFEDCNLNPRSTKFVGRVVGTQYLKWDSTSDKIELFGDFPNSSRYVRVELHPDLIAGAVDAKLVPFGFMGPARRKKFWISSGSLATPATGYTTLTASWASVENSYLRNAIGAATASISASFAFTASMHWPDYLLRETASNAAKGRAQNGYFGIRVGASETSKYYNNAYSDIAYPLEDGYDDWEKASSTEHTFAFSLDDVKQISSSAESFIDDASWAQGNRSTLVDNIAAWGTLWFHSDETNDYHNQTVTIEDTGGTSVVFTGDGASAPGTTTVTSPTDIKWGCKGGKPGREDLAASFFDALGKATTLDINISRPYNDYIELSQKTVGIAGNKLITSTIADLDGILTISGFALGGSQYFGSISARGKYYKSKGNNPPLEVKASNAAGWKTVIDAGYNKFTMPLHGGFDGTNIKNKNPFANRHLSSPAGTGQDNYAHFSVLTALKMIKDPEFLDFNLAAVPGLWESTLNEKLANYCEERGDALAILDVDSNFRPAEETKDTNLASSTTRGYCNKAIEYRKTKLGNVLHSYATCYYPWITIADGRTDSAVDVPPSVAMLGVFGSVAKNSEPWFAPAGFARGGLSDGTGGVTVINVKDRLTSSERDKLYESGINPIANFPAEGIVVFGQKTLQLKRSALDRINVRRLMIFLKRQIGSVAARTLFEQNVRETWQNFTDSAEEILAKVKDGLGLTDYKFILDETTTTPDMVDQNILYAKLFVKPARSIEFIALDFIITSTGAEFPE
jgi:hypothetical protein